MSTSLYGERYIDSHRFIAYCRSMNADSSLSSEDLERFEREGLLLPAARIVEPREYVLLRRAQFEPGGDPGAPIPGWEELENLLFGDMQEGLVHKFDAAFNRGNKFLFNPLITGFNPWDTYQVEVTNSSAESYFVDGATHFYHYWQIYQVYELQRKFPIFSKHHLLYEIIKDQIPEYWVQNIHPGNPNHIVDLYGYAPRFDALSYFTTMHANEQIQTFFLPNGNIRQLKAKEMQEYKDRQKAHAQSVIEQFRLNDAGDVLFDFLIHLLDLQADFRRQERIWLANEVEQDILNLVNFIFNVTDMDFSAIEGVLKSRADIGDQRQFRHLNKFLLAKDETQDVFDHLIKQFNSLFPNAALSGPQINQLIEYTFSNQLFIIPYAIYDIQEILNQGKFFRVTSLYVGLNNLSIGFESFLRTLSSGSGLNELINNYYSQDPTQKALFLDQFNDYVTRHSGTGSVERLYDVLTDQRLNDIPRAFLVSYYARNLIMHGYIEDSVLLGEMFSKIYTSICYAIFYTWHFALIHGFINP